MKVNLKMLCFTLLAASMLVFGCAKDNPTAPIIKDPVPIPDNTAAVNLGSAGNYVILAKTGIDTVPTSSVTGNIGISPADRTYLTGFSETMDASNVFSTCPQVTGNVYAADYAVPTPANMTAAISDMETAYVDAAGRVNPDFIELATGSIGGLTLAPGLYKWSSVVDISSDVTISGSSTDVWIFQISGDLTLANGIQVILSGGALAKNIIWQVTSATFGTTSHFEGIVLASTAITLNTGATVNGRLYAQTAVNMDSSTVVQPAP